MVWEWEFADLINRLFSIVKHGVAYVRQTGRKIERYTKWVEESGIYVKAGIKVSYIGFTIEIMRAYSKHGKKAEHIIAITGEYDPETLKLNLHRVILNLHLDMITERKIIEKYVEILEKLIKENS